MPAVQSTYTQTLRVAVAGMKGDMTPETIVSRVVEVAGLGFGVPAVKGTGDRQCRAASATPAAFLGITLIDSTLTPAQNATVDTYSVGDTAAIMIKGTVWVVASVAVAAQDQVYFVPATGVFTNVVGSNTIIPGGIFETSAGIGALAMIRLK